MAVEWESFLGDAFAETSSEKDPIPAYRRD
jgi:hypothetical protein